MRAGDSRGQAAFAAEAAKYIGAVDFHSWRGCTDEIVAQWHAAAWRYREVFNEQSFALYEINLYLRILAIAQPRSILQWQLTADYSVLTGGGIFNDSGRRDGSGISNSLPRRHHAPSHSPSNATNNPTSHAPPPATSSAASIPSTSSTTAPPVLRPSRDFLPA